MNFGQARDAAEAGDKVAREGWNGKGMFVFMIGGNAWSFTISRTGLPVSDLDTSPFLCLKTADNKLAPWLPSQTDMLADDWAVVD